MSEELTLKQLAALAADQLAQVQPNDDRSALRLASVAQLLVCIGSDDPDEAAQAFQAAHENARLANDEAAWLDEPAQRPDFG